MALFGKKKESSKSCCCGGCDCGSMARAEAARDAGAGVKVLGTDAARCGALAAAAGEALAELGMDTAVDRVSDFAQIAAFGVVTTPALVVDGRVVAYGKVLQKDEVRELLIKARGAQA
jgi:small redox-active disulfide protein 2